MRAGRRRLLLLPRTSQVQRLSALSNEKVGPSAARVICVKGKLRRGDRLAYRGRQRRRVVVQELLGARVVVAVTVARLWAAAGRRRSSAGQR